MTGTTVAGLADRASEGGFDRDAAVTRSLLGYGVLAGPFFLTVGLIQALVREGYDFGRHALSHLANGPGGWVQTLNFIVSGLMVIAAAVGFARVLRPQSRAAAWLLGLWGVSMLAAAVFPADPVAGFPPGTPEGVPTFISTSGLVHFMVGALGFTVLGVACFVTARAQKRRGERSMARLSVLSGLAVLIGFFGGGALSASSAGIAGIWFAVIAGWIWLAITSIHYYRAVSDTGRSRRAAP